jgi:transcription initiation factor TFIID subunit 6
VIDGKQPAIPENPSPEVNEFNTLADQQPSTSATDNNPPILRLLAKQTRKATPVQIKTTTTHSVCLEQQIFFKEIMEAVMGSDDSKRSVGHFCDLYNAFIKDALCTLQNDCGLQSLLPRFSVAIAEGVSFWNLH